MKILVTGGAGFIGSHVVDAYLAQGHEVVVVDDLSTGRTANLNPAVRFHPVDLRDPRLADIINTERPDVINHHAAQVDVRRSVADPLFDADVNVMGSLRLIEAAQSNGVQQFIYASTGGAVYGEPLYLPCDEGHPIRPICQYGASKYIVELYLYMYAANKGMRYTILRYGNVYGPRQDPHGEAGVVAIFTGRMVAGEQPMINGDGEQTRDFVYVGDCAHANVLALSDPHENMTYNIATGRGASINELFAAVQKVTGYSGPAAYGPPKAGETRHIYLDASLAREKLGWEPQVTLEEGLRHTAAQFQAEHT